ncbi:MAG TPA: stage II sporulation protein M, partial [Candidatus Dormibacteraeota bacterium]
MRAEDFVALRRSDWNRLEDLLARAAAGHLNALTPGQVLTMSALYRRATADLARAQRDWPGEPVHRYLNGLVARGHGIVYRRGGEVWKRIRGFYVETLPRTFRMSWPFLLASAALFFVPAIVAFFVVLAQPDAAYAIAS